MESLKLDNLFKKDCPKKVALIYSSQQGVIKEITFETLFSIAREIKSFMLRNIEDDNICIGLVMEKNLMVPSIIICFQDLKYAFVFLTIKTLVESVRHLGIKWILSVDSDIDNKTFSIKESLQLDGIELKLWMYDNFLKSIEYKTYQGIFCIVQTSGSTGENKVIWVPHACIEKNVINLNKHIDVSSNDVIYWGTPLTFDPTLVELILGISYQATLVFVPKLVALNPALLYQALFKVNLTTFLQIVPSLFLRWNKQQLSQILLNSSLKILAFGGEPFPKKILNYRRKQDLKLFNLYGVTELSCWATVADVTSLLLTANEVPLGETLDDTFIEVKNENEDVILNDIGEICIGSHTRYCLINGNKQASVPFIIKTGDLGEWKDGKLFYRGRKTRVIKRLGHKVALQEIENIIFNETELRSRLVYCEDLMKLLAFILIEKNYDDQSKIRLLDKLRVKLLKILPEHGFPDFLEVLTYFPLNEHGKICDKSLKGHYEKSLNGQQIEEHNAGDIFIDVLSAYLRMDIRENLKQLGKYTFFELGGNSILITQFLQAFRERVGVYVSLGELFTLALNESIQTCLNYVVDNITFPRRSFDVTLVKKTKILKTDSSQSNYVKWKYCLRACVDSTAFAFKRGDKTYIAAGSFANIFVIICENGEEYLKLTLPQEIEAQPCLSKCGNFVFVGCANGTMYSIDLNKKAIAWEFSTGQKIKCSVLLLETSIVFGSYDGFLRCLTAKDGTCLWSSELLGGIRADPILDRNLKRFYAGTIMGICYGLKKDGDILWSLKIDGPIFGTPCTVKDYVVWPCVVGKLYFTSPDGDLKQTIDINGHIFSSLIVYEDEIFFGCHDSYLYKISFSDTSHETSKTLQLESETSSSPFLYKYRDKVFAVTVCNIGILYVVDIASKTAVFRFRLREKSFSSPHVFENKVYIGCRDDYLYCIDIEEFVTNKTN